MKELVGHKILEVRFNFDSEDQIQFITDSGKIFTYTAYGDCCSSSYFTDINGIPELIGSTVLSHEYMEHPKEREVPKDGGESIQYYGDKLKTTGGYVDFIYHNASNGYYGGSLSCIDGPYSKASLTPLLGDYMAGDVFRTMIRQAADR